MGSGGGGQTQTTSPQLPPELSGVTSGAASAVQGLQPGATPVLQNILSGPPVQSVPGLTANQQQAGGMFQERAGQLAGLNPLQTPFAQATLAAIQEAVRPNLESTATQLGIANSPFVGQQINEALFQAIPQLLQQEMGERRSATQDLLGFGGQERDVLTGRSEAEQQASIRQQALAEALITGILGQLGPSTIGQKSTTTGGGGILGK